MEAHEPTASPNRSVLRRDTAVVPAASYTVADEEFQPHVPRPRVVARIIIEPASDAATAGSLASAARDMLSKYPNANVVRIFGYGEGDATTSFYTRGLSELSRDGNGWAGDGRYSLALNGAEDEGNILVLVGSATDQQPRAFILDR